MIAFNIFTKSGCSACKKEIPKLKKALKGYKVVIHDVGTPDGLTEFAMRGLTEDSLPYVVGEYESPI